MSGLTRYRSAPSVYFSGILGGGGGGVEDYAKLFNPAASSSETRRIFTMCMNAKGSAAAAQHPPPLPPRQKPSQKRRNDENPRPMAPPSGGNSGLIRQSSSPAGLFDNIIMEIDDFLNRLGEEDNKIFVEQDAQDDQKSEGGNRQPARLCHHLSLPKSFADMSVVEKLLQDSVPCKLWAKRGRATHPWCIAERVRRNKISEGRRKLQELVPNMDKRLSDNRAKCICPSNKVSYDLWEDQGRKEKYSSDVIVDGSWLHSGGV